MKNIKKILMFLLCLCAIIVIAIGVYLADYQKADEKAIQALQSSQSVSIQQLDGGDYAFVPQKAEAGMIFYPGGKVEHSAYALLMHSFAEQGILCVLVEMPGNLAVLDVAAAEEIQQQFPQVKRWYMGGHSLGGSMAASYVASNAEDFDGLLLLAAYSTEDLTDSALKVYSLYGSEDTVLDMENYMTYKSNLPDDTVEYIIAGGNHAQFGSYGVQQGDGQPQITVEEQINETIKNSMELFFAQEVQ